MVEGEILLNCHPSSLLSFMSVDRLNPTAAVQGTALGLSCLLLVNLGWQPADRADNEEMELCKKQGVKIFIYLPEFGTFFKKKKNPVICYLSN